LIIVSRERAGIKGHFASDVSSGSSTGTNFAVQTETLFSKTMNSLVYKIDEEKELIWIAYPWRLFDR